MSFNLYKKKKKVPKGGKIDLADVQRNRQMSERWFSKGKQDVVEIFRIPENQGFRSPLPNVNTSRRCIPGEELVWLESLVRIIRQETHQRRLKK